MTTKTAKESRVRVVDNSAELETLQKHLDQAEQTMTASAQLVNEIRNEAENDPDPRKQYVARGALEIVQARHKRIEDNWMKQDQRLALQRGLETGYAERLAHALAQDPEIEDDVEIVVGGGGTRLPFLSVQPIPSGPQGAGPAGLAEHGRWLQVTYVVPHRWQGLPNHVISKAIKAAGMRKELHTVDDWIDQHEIGGGPATTYVYKTGPLQIIAEPEDSE